MWPREAARRTCARAQQPPAALRAAGRMSLDMRGAGVHAYLVPPHLAVTRARRAPTPRLYSLLVRPLVRVHSCAGVQNHPTQHHNRTHAHALFAARAQRTALHLSA
ncbi:hypothetical protein EON67_01895 [archaeon]|nr:MAG: hypothetical protein EON67_01895 [archaeon]